MSGSESISGSIVFFIFLSLIMMLGCYEVKRRIHLPIPSSLLLIGIFLRVVAPYSTNLNSSVDLIKDIHYNVISYTMLPMLLLKSSFSINWHLFKQGFIQILILSTSVAIINIFLVSCTFKYILGYNYS